MTDAIPARVRVRMYQVGFGDCFLVSFEYDAPVDGRAERHILFDFGSVRRPRQGRGDPAAVARLIAQHTGGKLDAVVVSHRHKDHLSGFAHQVAGQILDGLEPRMVVRSWTEKPDEAPAAGSALRGDHEVPTDLQGGSPQTSPSAGSAGGSPQTSPSAGSAGGSPQTSKEIGQGVAPPGERSKKFVAELATGERFAAQLEHALAGAVGARGSLRELAAAQTGNAAAIARLDGWAKRGAGAYVQLGGDSGIEQLIPGIKVHVLGPPTIEECPEMRGEAQNDPDYWLYYHALLTNRAAAPREVEASPSPTANPQPPAPAQAQPGPIRWLIERMRGQRVASLQRVVHTVDDALNNTSVLLLIEAGDKRLLFPGDAQIEIWRYALGRPGVTDLLGRVDLYKVGHHGSRNASPRSLVKLWNAPENAAHPMTALMSTLQDVYGESEATAVPRATLVDALRRRTTLIATNELPQGQAFVEVVAELSGGKPFEVVS